MTKIALEVEYDDDPINGIFWKMSELIGGNPARRSYIKLSSSSHTIKSSLAGIVETNWDDFILTGSKDNHHIMIDFKTHKVDLSRYSLQTGQRPKGVDHLKSWKLEGSNDKENFALLDSHKDSQELNGSRNVFLSNPIKCQEPYRYLRLTMLDKNWSGKRKLFLQRFEIFGKIYGDEYKSELSDALSHEKDIENYRSLFKIIDTNGNGLLEPEELSVFFEKYFPLPLKMVPLAFRICDTDNSGSIDFDEFKGFFGKLTTLKSNNPLPAYHMLFDALDSNKDGILNIAEFVEFATLVQIDITPEEARSIIKEYSNGKKGLNFDDIYRACLDPAATHGTITPKHYSKEEIDALQKEFNNLDKDGNGELDREELIKFVGGDPEEASIVVDRVFLLCDYDKSGTISFDEYIEFCNTIALLTQDEQKFFEKIFYALDKDHVGTLDFDNLVQFYRLVLCEMDENDVKKQIAEKDTDKDGRLTFLEAIDFQ